MKYTKQQANKKKKAINRCLERNEALPPNRLLILEILLDY